LAQRLRTDPAFLNAFLAVPMREIRNSGILLDMTPLIDLKWPSARRTSAHSKSVINPAFGGKSN
jgi:hypothetical protein